MILVPQKVIDNHGISRYNEDKIKYYESPAVICQVLND